jgi:hypothetical protein
VIVILCFLTFTFRGLIEYYYGMVHTYGTYVTPRLLECLFAFQSCRFASVYSILIIFIFSKLKTLFFIDFMVRLYLITEMRPCTAIGRKLVLHTSSTTTGGLPADACGTSLYGRYVRTACLGPRLHDVCLHGGYMGDFQVPPPVQHPYSRCVSFSLFIYFSLCQ